MEHSIDFIINLSNEFPEAYVWDFGYHQEAELSKLTNDMVSDIIAHNPADYFDYKFDRVPEFNSSGKTKRAAKALLRKNPILYTLGYKLHRNMFLLDLLPDLWDSLNKKDVYMYELSKFPDEVDFIADLMSKNFPDKYIESGMAEDENLAKHFVNISYAANALTKLSQYQDTIRSSTNNSKLWRQKMLKNDFYASLEKRLAKNKARRGAQIKRAWNKDLYNLEDTESKEYYQRHRKSPLSELDYEILEDADPRNKYDEFEGFGDDLYHEDLDIGGFEEEDDYLHSDHPHRNSDMDHTSSKLLDTKDNNRIMAEASGQLHGIARSLRKNGHVEAANMVARAAIEFEGDDEDEYRRANRCSVISTDRDTYGKVLFKGSFHDCQRFVRKNRDLDLDIVDFRGSSKWHMIE